MNTTETGGGQYPRDVGADEIEKLLPHRGGILFARQIRLLAPGRYLGFVSWEATSMGIAGHFPSMPIIPAVYLIEAAAQIAGAGMLATTPDVECASSARIGVLAGVRRCVFTKPVLPGQQVVFDLGVDRRGGAFVFVQGDASVAASRVASFDLIVALAPRSQIFPQA